LGDELTSAPEVTKTESTRRIRESDPSERGASGTRALAAVMFAVLLASYVINAMDRQLFPLLAADVRREYGFSLPRIGLLSTIFTLGMAIAGLPTGYLLARWSRKAVLQIGIAIFSAGTVLTVLSHGFPDMLTYRAATGIGEAMELTALLAIAANYFTGYRAVAVGSVNFCFATGAIIGPILGGIVLSAYRSWRLPMVFFGLLGALAMVLIAVIVKPSLTERSSETRDSSRGSGDLGGASKVLNRNTVLLTAMSLIGGLVIYGYLGMYPTFLREGLHYTPTAAGAVVGAFGAGALGSIAGGWLGDRFSPRYVLGVSFLCAAGLGYLLFHTSAFAVQSALSFAWGFIVSGTIYVNLAGYHVKAVRNSLANRASGIFVTSLYGSAALGGYLMGWIVGRGGWVAAGEIQLAALSLAGGALALALRPAEMSP
jgi:MFS transporter, DHA1 family, inner membrane transport protein